MRILVIDDHLDVREIVRHYMEDLGHSVKEASSGNKAISLLKEDSSFDFIISDYQMLDGNGLDVLRYLASVGAKNKFIFFTSYTGLESFINYEHFRGIFSKAEILKVIRVINEVSI